MQRIILKSRLVLFTFLAVTFTLKGAPAAPTPGSQTVAVPTAMHAVRHDISQPLRNIKEPEKTKAVIHKEHPVKALPALPPTHAPLGADHTLQTKAVLPLSVSAPVKFSGISFTDEYSNVSDPPDTNGSAGDKMYVEWVNTLFEVFDKASHSKVFGPADGSIVWRGFGGRCEKYNDGDPIVLYDKRAHRWLMSQFAVSGGPPYSQCIAVSRTDDPTGAYARYEFQFKDMNDYPKFGIWPDGYYATFNMFRNGKTFVGGKACAFQRDKMLQGLQARWTCFGTSGGGLLPADVDGAASPPAGSPELFAAFGPNELMIWRFHVNWQNMALSKVNGPISIPVSPFQEPCETCVRQPNTTQQLDTLGDRLMYRLSYRRLASTDLLLANHTVQTRDGNIGIRWYVIGAPFGQPSIKQTGTYAPDAISRWMASVAMDKLGDLLVGYSASASSVYPSIRFTGRAAGDPAGQLAQEEILQPGKGSQVIPSRWGDYSSMTIDPIDDCTFWFTTQYQDYNSGYTWKTAVAEFHYPACH